MTVSLVGESRALRLIRSEPQVVLATWQDVFVSIWRAGACLEQVEATGAAMRRLHADCPSGIASFSMVDVSLIFPGNPVLRAASERLTQETADLVRQRVAVIAAEGFRASAVRSVLTGLFLKRGELPAFATTTTMGEQLMAERLARPREWGAELAGAVERAARLP